MTSPLRLCVRRSPAPDAERRRDAGDAPPAQRSRAASRRRSSWSPATASPARRRSRRPASGSRWCSPRRSATPSCAATARTAASGWTCAPSWSPTPSGSYVTDEGPGFDPGRGARADPPGAARRGQRARPLSHPEARGRGAVQRARKLHLHDTAPPVGRLDHVLDGLGALVGGRVRLWRFDGRALRLAGGADPGWSPRCRAARAASRRPTGRSGSSR